MSEITTIEKDVSEIVAVANGIRITDNDQEMFAVEFLKNIKAGKELVGKEFDDNIKKAHAVHKALTAQRKKYLDPLEQADEIVRGAIKPISFMVV